MTPEQIKMLSNLSRSIILRYGLDDILHINRGWCFIWAWIAHRLLPGSQLASQDGHAFIVYGGRYYDAECLPNGVSHFQELPINQPFPENKFRMQSVKDFYRHWTSKITRNFKLCGDLRDTDMLKLIEKEVKEIAA